MNDEDRIPLETWRQLEDEAAAVRDWPEEKRALFYVTLYRTGMRLETAENVIAKRRPR